MTGNGISLATLGVADLARSSPYYQALGWQSSSGDNEQVVFLKGHNLVLGLYGRSALAENMQVEGRPTGFTAIALACNCVSRDEVDRLFSAATAAGGQATKIPQEVFWGSYSGYTADPDGRLWEITYNPSWPFDEQGSLVLPWGRYGWESAPLGGAFSLAAVSLYSASGAVRATSLAQIV